MLRQTQPPGKIKKYKKSDTVLISEMADIVAEVEEVFRFKPEYYKSMACRLVDYMVRERPHLFKKRVEDEPTQDPGEQR